ncbi:MAG: exodeoxyribonuclease VII large subunit [Bdellovibrionaceae bacterium]|nr:exodeoxyribonuclease VII large subunit [Pseudobdellovibrionaceae bacterium]
MTLPPLGLQNNAQKAGPFPLTSTGSAVLSIEQLNLQIKHTLEGTLGIFWAQGEISNFKPHTSGHFYFSLKDAKSQISAVMFRGFNSKLKFKPHDGLEVIVRGRLGVYEPRGTYQILCETMEPVGAGALQKAFEQLKEKLKKEGLFDSVRKKPIPAYPRHVAIVTSETGAAIRDILNILSRRAPGVQITVVPTLVQGEGSAAKIKEALIMAQRLPQVDVIIIGRGGGSIEDLWAFNDEILARAIAACQIPIISAVGHEIDFTISDFVADLRAPTPSAAAELVAKTSQEVLERLQNLKRFLFSSFDRRLKTLGQVLYRYQKQLIDPKRKLQDLLLRHDDLNTRLEMGIQRQIKDKLFALKLKTQRIIHPKKVFEKYREQRRHLHKEMTLNFHQSLRNLRNNLAIQMKALGNLSPLNVVDRGYSLVTLNGALVRSVNQLKIKDQVEIQLAEGKVFAEVLTLIE